MPKEITDNPAWRLHDLIENALRSPHGTLADFWASGMSINRTDVKEIFRGLVLAHALIDETEHLLRAAEINHNFFLAKMAPLREGFSFMNLDISAAAAVNILGPLLREVGYWATALDSTNFAARLSNERLSELATELNSVYEGVRSAAIDEDLKRVILDALEATRRAINEYRIRGSAGLREEVDRAAVLFARHARALRSYSQESWLERLGSFFGQLESAVQTGTKLLPLFKSGSALLQITSGDE